MAEPVLEWDSKDPDESDRFAVDWLPRLVDGDVIAASTWVAIVPAGITITDDVFDDRYSYAKLSGGTDGEVAEIQVSIVTAAGYEAEVTRRLAIISSAGTATSGYVVPTVAAFVSTFPKFRDVDPAVIQAALNFAGTKVDETWTEGDYSRAYMLYAAHTLTLDGHGTGTDSQMAAEGLSGFRRIKSASLEVERFGNAADSGLSSTSYGNQYKELLRLNFAGPRLVPGAQAGRCSPYATDC